MKKVLGILFGGFFGWILGAVATKIISSNPFRVSEDDIWSEETDPATYEFEGESG